MTCCLPAVHTLASCITTRRLRAHQYYMSIARSPCCRENAYILYRFIRFVQAKARILCS